MDEKSPNLPTLFKLNEIDTPTEVVGKYERNYNQALHEDIVETITFFAQTYVPNYSEEDLAGLTEAVDYFNKNRNTFEESLLLNDEDRTLPVEAERFIRTLAQIIFAEHFRNIENKVVSFVPGTLEWKNDVRNLTLDEFDKFRYRVPEGRPYIKNKASSTRLIAAINEFFASGGKQKREEGIDSLLSVLLQKYYLRLSQRSQGVESKS